MRRGVKNESQFTYADGVAHRENSMRITEFADIYCREKSIAKTPLYSANRFARYVGDIETDQINREVIERFIAAAKSAGNVSAETIRGTVKDVATLCKAAGGESVKVVCQRKVPDPRPTPLEDIAAIIPFLAEWSLQWLVLAYWTAMRLDNVIRVQRIIQPAKTLRFQATKTGWRHVWPMPDWIQKFMRPVKLPYGKCPDWSQVIVRGELERASKIAGVERVLPKGIRQRSLTEWTVADRAAGAIIHGNGLKIMDHYVAHQEILENAMHRVRLPAGLRDPAEETPENDLILHFRRLDCEAQKLIVSTTRRMSGA